MLLFTSGTTGKPIGAFKTKENLEDDIKALVKVLKKYNPKRVISSVPFVHIYGVLTSILLPYYLDIDLFFKKHFLPHDLLEAIEPNSIIVTIPVYIKSLLRLEETKNLKDVLFISSTAPLDAKSAADFIKKFNTNLIQLYGSTETGSIAYKEQNEPLWTPFQSVAASTKKNNLLKISSPFVSRILYEDGLRKTGGVIQSFDYVTFCEDRFQIIGRKSQIFKVAGKRFSSMQVEEILESIDRVKKALVVVKYHKNELKDESLEIYLQGSEEISLKEVNQILKEKIGNIKIPITLRVVAKIQTTVLGKNEMPLS